MTALDRAAYLAGSAASDQATLAHFDKLPMTWWLERVTVNFKEKP